MLQSTGAALAPLASAHVTLTLPPATNGSDVPCAPLATSASATVKFDGATLFSEIIKGSTTSGFGQPIVPPDEPAPCKTGLAELKPRNV
ncbi:hypothetical protein [Caballeronia sp. INDeC2]|uniref:hypothetical protein n=1 Tax=Caballeronia sp. INDeC2 TaxID=2921747 RepID=UPI002028811A|nr:hypothetical protein [Caballeronia sp. INDeC2]